MALSKLAKRRLTKLIAFMAKRKETGHFYMAHWFSHSGREHDHGIAAGTEINAEHLEQCGTTACALGWAATMPYFKKLGLRMVAHEEGGANMFGPGGTGDSFVVAEKIFDINADQAWELFGVSSARSEKQWAQRASRLMCEWESETV